jgi:hypothetical protein
MVKAILKGQKTQTRRVVKLNPSGHDVSCYSFKTRNFIKCHDLEDDHCAPCGFGFQNESKFWRCPYGEPGDRLWVRETHAFVFHPDGDLDGEQYSVECENGETGRFSVRYAADGCAVDWDGGWRPSIFTPRWASRITLEITGVRVERLNQISEADAVAEGVECVKLRFWKDYDGKEGVYVNPILSYQSLWSSINGPGSWDANPFVWVIEFRRVQ